MACFDNIIALRETCTSTTSSGYYLNDFGINKAEIEAIITNDYDSVQDYLDKKIEFTTNVVTNDIVTHFSNVQAKTLIQSHRVGIFNKNLVTVTGGGYRGIHVNICNVDSFLEFHLAEVSTLTDFTGSLPILVYDLTQNKLLDTITVTSTAGNVSTSFPHKTYKTNRQGIDLWIGYDATGIDSYKTTIRSGSCCGRYTCTNSVTTSKGASITAPYVNSNLTTLPDTAGVSLLYSVSCDHKGWLCTYLQQIALAVGYKVCAEIMFTGANSAFNSRSTNMTTLNRDSLKMRFDFYEMKYRETMDNLLRNIKTPEGICYKCTSPVTHATVLP